MGRFRKRFYLLFVARGDEGHLRKLSIRVDYVLISLAVVILCSISLYVVPRLRVTKPEQIRNWIWTHPRTIACLLTANVAAVGALASYWKKKALRSYAIMEVSFGCVLSFNVLLHIAPNIEFSKLFALGSAVYVIARGFNNLSDARKVSTFELVREGPMRIGEPSESTANKGRGAT